MDIQALLQKWGVPCFTGVNFAQLTTYGTGGEIALTVRPQSIKQLVKTVRLLRRRKVKHCILGHGSNVLASDSPYNGVVVVTTHLRELSVEGQYVTAACGVSTAQLSAVLVEKGLTGGEFFGCLPATVGGAVVCNAGCFKQCAAQVVAGVEVLFRGRRRHLTNAQCRFEKRNSIFKNNSDFVLLQVELRFPRASVNQVRQTVADMRRKKAETQPLNARSAGCVLYSDKAAVSRLIDQAGLKGFRLGGAAVSEKHAGFVINLDKATSRDIYLLIQHVKNILTEKFGLTPQTELCLINFDSTGRP